MYHRPFLFLLLSMGENLLLREQRGGGTMSEGWCGACFSVVSVLPPRVYTIIIILFQKIAFLAKIFFYFGKKNIESVPRARNALSLSLSYTLFCLSSILSLSLSLVLSLFPITFLSLLFFLVQLFLSLAFSLLFWKNVKPTHSPFFS